MTTIDRTPKPCLHKRANHQHGHRTTYVLDRCRCLPCAAANSDYELRRARNRGYGRPTTTWVDAEPVRQHVRAILATGVGWKRIGKVADVASGTMTTLLYGKTRENGRRDAPCRRMNPEAARRLLELPLPTVTQLPGGVAVDGTGTRRRIQALACLGWSVGAISREAGIDRQSLDGAMRGRPVLARTHQAVVDVYERLWNHPAAGRDHAEKIAVSRTANRARREGWTPPSAWDDDEIDDPTAEPITGDVGEDLVDEHALDLVLDGQPMRLTGRDLEVAVDRLVDDGLSYADVAARVRSDETTVRRIRNTALKARRRAEEAA